MKKSITYQVAVIGAGPYGLATAAHLRAAGIETRVFGETMEFWAKQMPQGMLVRSIWEACHIADPHRKFTLDAYTAQEKIALRQPLTLNEFVDYGRWFQQQAVPEVDCRRVTRVEAAPHGLRVHLSDGETHEVRQVVVATGIAPFAWKPPQFHGLPAELASHTCGHRDMSRFAGRRVVVVGGGQMALEAAAILHEKGAVVEVVVRQPKVHWLDQTVPWLRSDANPLRRVFYPPTDVGPPGLNWIVATPNLFRRLPRELQKKVAHRSIRPAATGWLIPRLATVPITEGCAVESATRSGDELRLGLSDGTQRDCDHVLLGTGFRVDISRYGFLAPELLAALSMTDGYPNLTAGFESSVPGLHFVGAPAAHSFGPVCRFVSGTTFAGRSVARHLTGKGPLKSHHVQPIPAPPAIPQSLPMLAKKDGDS